MTKKIIALLLSVMMLLGVFAGCGPEAPAQVETTEDPIPTVAGALVLTAGASMKITYDTEGMVMSVTGYNESGSALANVYPSMGKSCSTAIKELIAESAKAGYLPETVKNIIVKLADDATMPNEQFLDNLVNDAKSAAQAANSSAVVTGIGPDGLDKDGCINPETAKALLVNQLGEESTATVGGSGILTNGVYLFVVKTNNAQTAYTVDATTGLMSEGTIENQPDSGENVDSGNSMDIDVDYAEDTQGNQAEQGEEEENNEDISAPL